MKLFGFLLAMMTAAALLQGAECGSEPAMQRHQLKSAVAQRLDISDADVFSLKEVRTSGGYAFLFYVRLPGDDTHAHSMLVTLDSDCNIHYMQPEPRKSDLLLLTSN